MLWGLGMSRNAISASKRAVSLLIYSSGCRPSVRLIIISFAESTLQDSFISINTSVQLPPTRAVQLPLPDFAWARTAAERRHRLQQLITAFPSIPGHRLLIRNISIYFLRVILLSSASLFLNNPLAHRELWFNDDTAIRFGMRRGGRGTFHGNWHRPIRNKMGF